MVKIDVITHDMLFGDNEYYDKFILNLEDCTPEESFKIRMEQMDRELDLIRARESDPDYY